MAANADAVIWGVLGASGTGKGVWAKPKLRELNAPRMVFWDFMNEYQEFTGERQAKGHVKGAPAKATLADVLTAMIAAGDDGPLRIRYSPKGRGEKAVRKEFEALCELVYAWENCVFVAEELANVTTPGWAPPAWKKMCTSGRHQRVHIVGFSQTPALIDKTFLGNCTLIHCSALREHPHRQAVALKMDIDQGRIDLLEKFQYIEKDFDSGVVTTGWVAPPGKRPKGPPVVVATEPSPTRRRKRTPSVAA